MPRFSQASITGLGDDPVAVYLSGEGFVLRSRLEDDDGNAVTLVGATLACAGEWYECDLTGSGRSQAISNINRIVDEQTDQPLDTETLVTAIDSDQTANTGVFTITFPSTLIGGSGNPAEPALDATTLPLLVCYIGYTDSASSIQKTRFGIVYRRGTAA